MNNNFKIGFIKNAQAHGITAVEADRLYKLANFGDFWTGATKETGDNIQNAWSSAMDNPVFNGFRAASRFTHDSANPSSWNWGHFGQDYDAASQEQATQRAQSMLGQMNSYRDQDGGGLGNADLIKQRSQQIGELVNTRINDPNVQATLGEGIHGVQSTYDQNATAARQTAGNLAASRGNFNKLTGWNPTPSNAPFKQTAGFMPAKPTPMGPTPGAGGSPQADSQFIKTQMPRMGANNNYGMGPQRPVHF